MRKNLMVFAALIAAISLVTFVTGCKSSKGSSVSKVNITFDAGEGKFANGESKKVVPIEKGGKLIGPGEDPVLAGHVFKGWFTEEEGEGRELDIIFSHNDPVTYHAFWKEGEEEEDPGVESGTVTIKIGEEEQDVTVTKNHSTSTLKILEGGNGYSYNKGGAGHRGRYAWFKVDLGDGKKLEDFSAVTFDYKGTATRTDIALIANTGQFSTDLVQHPTGGSNLPAWGSSFGYLARGQVSEAEKGGALDGFVVLRINDSAANANGTNDTLAKAALAEQELWFSIYEHIGGGTTSVISNIVFKEKVDCLTCVPLASNCTVCSVCYQDIHGAAHSPIGDWEKDASGHWKECEHCTAKADFATHDSDDKQANNCLDPTKCNICDFTIKQALTGHTWSALLGKCSLCPVLCPNTASHSATDCPTCGFNASVFACKCTSCVISKTTLCTCTSAADCVTNDCETKCKCCDGLIFYLADWMAANPDISAPIPETGAAAAVIVEPLGVSSNAQLTAIDSSSLTIARNGSNASFTINTGSSSGGLNLAALSTTRLIEVTIEGTIIGAPGSSTHLILRGGSSDTVGFAQSTSFDGDNSAFTIKVVLPANFSASDLRFTPSPGNNTLGYKVTKILIRDTGERNCEICGEPVVNGCDCCDVCGKTDCDCDPGLVFSLAAWLKENNNTVPSSTGARPFARTSGTPTISVVEGGINVSGRTGSHHTMSIWVNNTGLDLKPAARIYEITVIGSITGSLADDDNVRMGLRNEAGGTYPALTSTSLSGDNAAFTIKGELPSDFTNNELRIQPVLSVTEAAGTTGFMNFRITDVKVEDKGPRT